MGQSQQPLRNGAFLRSGDTVNATLFPLWAAGLTGAGMVVGIGDSGLGATIVQWPHAYHAAHQRDTLHA